MCFSVSELTILNVRFGLNRTVSELTILNNIVNDTNDKLSQDAF